MKKRLESSAFVEKEEALEEREQNMRKLDVNIPVMRHFDDINNLLKFGRDSELIPGQENKALSVAQEIYIETKKENKKAVIFICSSEKRAIQTADITVDQLRKIDNGLRLQVVAEESLTAINQGKFILPPDYKPGGPFAGFDLANKAFIKEAFASDNGNYLYKFGDPVLQHNGSYKYPELVPYFKSYGETNRDFLLRIYGLVVRTYDKIDKLNSKTKIVVITHAQLYQIFRDLSTIANMAKNEGLDIKTGELPKLCWSLYSKRLESEKPTYGINYISIENLRDPKIIELLKKEIEYLKKLK